jgi:hypothetical protein
VVALAGLLVFAGSARAQLSSTVRLGADSVDEPVTSVATNGARTLVAGEDLAHVRRDARGGAVRLGDGESGGDARALALSPDGATRWVGGFFDTVNGTPRRVLAAVDSATGALRPWQPTSAFEPYMLATYGNVVYAGGAAWDGSRWHSFVAFDAATGAGLGYGPERYGSSFALAPGGRTLYVGRPTTRRTFTLAAGSHALSARRLAGRARLARGRYTLTVKVGATTRTLRFRVAR